MASTAPWGKAWLMAEEVIGHIAVGHWGKRPHATPCHHLGVWGRATTGDLAFVLGLKISEATISYLMIRYNSFTWLKKFEHRTKEQIICI